MRNESPKIMREKEKKKVDDFLFESLIVKGLIFCYMACDKKRS
jgi:hypothetical protein